MTISEKAAKQVGSEIIDLTEVLSSDMQTWSEQPVRPYGLSETECVGFITREDVGHSLSFIADLMMPASSRQATLRLWAAYVEKAESDERFTTIQLDFSVDYDRALQMASTGSGITRSMLRELLDDEATTHVQRVMAGLKTGFDAEKNQPLGERYEYTASELATSPEDAEKTVALLRTAVQHIASATHHIAN